MQERLSKHVDQVVGCSIAFILIIEDIAYTLNIGNLNLLLRHEGKVYRLSKESRLSQDTLTSCPLNFLGNRPGQRELVVDDMAEIKLNLGDRLVLASDGMSLSAKQWGEVLCQEQEQASCGKKLFELAQERNPMDNKTLIVLDVVEPEVEVKDEKVEQSAKTEAEEHPVAGEHQTSKQSAINLDFLVTNEEETNSLHVSEQTDKQEDENLLDRFTLANFDPEQHRNLDRYEDVDDIYREGSYQLNNDPFYRNSDDYYENEDDAYALGYEATEDVAYNDDYDYEPDYDLEQPAQAKYRKRRKKHEVAKSRSKAKKQRRKNPQHRQLPETKMSLGSRFGAGVKLFFQSLGFGILLGFLLMLLAYIFLW